MTYQKVRKQLKRRGNSSDPSMICPVLPFVKISPASLRMLNESVSLAKTGMFIVISGHPGDFAEAPAFFLDCLAKLGLTRYANVLPGRELETIKLARNFNAEALFFSEASQIPTGVQGLLVDEKFPKLRLVLMCVGDQKRIDPGSHFQPALLNRCHVPFLRWPAWDRRVEDHEILMTSILRMLEKQNQVHIQLTDRARQILSLYKWQSVTHLVVELAGAVEQRAEECDTVVLDEYSLKKSQTAGELSAVGT